MEALVIKIVFGILLGVGGAVMILLAFLLFYKYLLQEKRCTAKAVGVVKRYTLSSKGPEHSGIFLPVVYYTVNGKEYKVVGPEYKSYILVTKSTPISENKTDFSIENQVLKIRRSTNSVVANKTNPIKERYPIGASADVYYDPQNPKLAYVLRYCNKKFGFWLMFIFGISLLVGNAVLLLTL